MLQVLRPQARARLRSSLACTIVSTLLPLLLASLSLAGCGERAPRATTLLQEAQARYAAAQSFHVLYLVEEAQHLTRSDTFYLTRADGDIERPDKLSAAVNVLTPSGALSGAKLIVTGGQGWLANPQTDQDQRDDDVVPSARLFDPHTGLGALLTQIAQPTPTQGYKDIWITSGSVPADTLSAILPQLAGHTDAVGLELTQFSGSSEELVNRDERLCGMVEPVRSVMEVTHVSSCSGARPQSAGGALPRC